MRGSVRSPHISRFAGAVAALWLCGTGSAWAGHGGGDVVSLQAALTQACKDLQITSCPQLPTVSQLVLEVAGLGNGPPEVVRFENAFSSTAAVNAVNPPAGSTLPLLTGVTPLAFISPSTSGGAAMVTQRGDPSANSFFYAATNGASGSPPFLLFLFYDYPPLTNSNFAKGQLVAEISIPLVVLNSNGTESEAPTTIQIRGASGCGTIDPCVSATAVGNFGSGLQSVDAASLGLIVTLTFPQTSTPPHAIFEVQVPLLVTHSNDPAYFFDDPAYALFPQFFPFLPPPPAFINNELGFTPKFLGKPVGIAPFAAPHCRPGDVVTNGGCANSSPPPQSNFPLCASIAVDGIMRPAVAAFFSIGTVGTTYVSAPLPAFASPLITCPF